MNICMISSDFLPNVGGISAHVYELSKTFVRKGNKVLVINIIENNPNHLDISRKKLEGITIYHISTTTKFYVSKIIKISFLIFPKLTSHIIMNSKKIFNSELIDFIDNLLEDQNVDVLHSHTIRDAILCRFLNTNALRVFTNHSSMYLLSLVGWKKIPNMLWYKAILSHLDIILAPSKELYIKSQLFGLNKNIYYIPNGVDTLKFKPNLNTRNLRKYLNIDKNDFIVICPRRLVKKNGVEYFIKSIPFILKEIDNIKFIILGNGPERKRLAELVNNLNINRKIIFLGEVSNIKMPLFYNLADIVVIPSLIEATSIAGLEAMSCGIPLIGSNTGGLPEIINNRKTGFVVQPKNEKEISKYVILLLKNSKLRYSMDKAARKLALAKFDWSIIAKRTFSIYKKLLKLKAVDDL